MALDNFSSAASVHWISTKEYDSFLSQQPLFVDTERAFVSLVGESDLSTYIPIPPFVEDSNGLGMLKIWYGYTEFMRFYIAVYPKRDTPYTRLVPALDDVSGWSTQELLIHFSFLPKLFFRQIISISPFIEDGDWAILTNIRGEECDVLRSSNRDQLESIAELLVKLSENPSFRVEALE